jgi:hypothetical protein
MKGYEAALAAVDRLTDRDREIVAGVDTVDFAGFTLPVGSATKFSTREGLDQQIAEFTAPMGQVYIWSWVENADSGKFDMTTYVIDKS